MLDLWRAGTLSEDVTKRKRKCIVTALNAQEELKRGDLVHISWEKEREFSNL